MCSWYGDFSFIAICQPTECEKKGKKSWNHSIISAIDDAYKRPRVNEIDCGPYNVLVMLKRCNFHVMDPELHAAFNGRMWGEMDRPRTKKNCLSCTQYKKLSRAERAQEKQ